MPPVRALRGRVRNGLPWRTGVVILTVVNLARHTRPGPGAGTYTDVVIWSCARRLRNALFGGSNGPAVDPSFRGARKFVGARPVARYLSCRRS